MSDDPTSAARFVLDPAFEVGRVDARMFGSFVEHLGRCVYTGVYEPGHPRADADGMRADVLDLIRELGVTVIRYPGGNFVSGYRWEDGVGPMEQRPRRLDPAWHSIETNAFGLSEFIDTLRKLPGAEPMLAVNLGTRGIAEALDLLEYANHPGGTALSDQRVEAGDTEPYDVRLWCLGNEMDGPWQIGFKSADEYGRLAAATGSAMRLIDPGIELVACGSSARDMDTFGAWEATVLDHTYDLVDYISMHAYYEETNGDRDSFLASAVDMEAFIDGVVATCDHVAAKRKSAKKMRISFDEWNVWYTSRPDSESATRLDVRAATARERLHGHRRRRCRLDAHRAAATRGPHRHRVPGPTRQRHRPDYDRTRRAGLAPDHLLPLRPDRHARPRRPRPHCPR